MLQTLQNYGNFEQAGSAQYSAIKTYDYLRNLYAFFRNRQDGIDKTFDNVSKSIGLVITTTLPIQVEISKGKINSISIGTGQLTNTLFEQKFNDFLQSFKTLTDERLSTIPDGSYNLYLIWLDALNLRLRSDFMDPGSSSGSTPTTFRPVPPVVREPVHNNWGVGIREPVHWIDPGSIDLNEAIQISAIDDIYPELKLADRIILTQQINSVTFNAKPNRLSTTLRHIEDTITPERLPQFLDEMSSLLRRYGYRF